MSYFVGDFEDGAPIFAAAELAGLSVPAMARRTSEIRFAFERLQPLMG